VRRFIDELPENGEMKENRGVLQKQRKEGCARRRCATFHSFRVTGDAGTEWASRWNRSTRHWASHREHCDEALLPAWEDEFRRTLAGRCRRCSSAEIPSRCRQTGGRSTKLLEMRPENWAEIREEILAKLGELRLPRSSRSRRRSLMILPATSSPVCQLLPRGG